MLKKFHAPRDAFEWKQIKKEHKIRNCIRRILSHEATLRPLHSNELHVKGHM